MESIKYLISAGGDQAIRDLNSWLHFPKNNKFRLGLRLISQLTPGLKPMRDRSFSPVGEMRFFGYGKLPIGLNGITGTFIFVRHCLRKFSKAKLRNRWIGQLSCDDGRFVILLPIKTKLIFLIERERQGLQPFPVIEGSSGPQGAGMVKMG